MEKPFTLKVEDLKNNIINIINEAKMPSFVVKNVLQAIYQEVNKIEQEEIENYKKEQGGDING